MAKHTLLTRLGEKLFFLNSDRSMKVFQVVHVAYDDDYKQEDPTVNFDVFGTREDADEYLKENICNDMCGYTAEENCLKCTKECKHFDPLWSLPKMLKYWEEHIEGEYVSVRAEYWIVEKDL